MSQPAAPGARALQRANRALTTRQQMLPALARRAAPAIARSAATLAVGFAAEYALRALANRAVGAFISPLRRTAPAITRTVTRTVVTELVVINWVRRRS
jgi:hypothetical protein